MPRYGGAYSFLRLCRVVAETVLVFGAGVQMTIRCSVFILWLRKAQGARVSLTPYSDI